MDSIASKKLHHHHPAISATHRCLSYSQNNYRDLFSAREPGGHLTAAYGMKEAWGLLVHGAGLMSRCWGLYLDYLCLPPLRWKLLWLVILQQHCELGGFSSLFADNTLWTRGFIHCGYVVCLKIDLDVYNCLELEGGRKKEMFERLGALWYVHKVKIYTELNGFSQRLAVERSAVPRISIKAIFCVCKKNSKYVITIIILKQQKKKNWMGSSLPDAQVIFWKLFKTQATAKPAVTQTGENRHKHRV